MDGLRDCFLHAGNIEVGRLGDVLGVGMPVTNEMQALLVSIINFPLFARSVGAKRKPRSQIAKPRTCCLFDNYVGEFEAGEELPARLCSPYPGLAMLPEMTKDGICKNDALTRTVYQKSDHAAAVSPLSELAFGHLRSKTNPPSGRNCGSFRQVSDQLPFVASKRFFDATHTLWTVTLHSSRSASNARSAMTLLAIFSSTGPYG